jgi:hypothetical protein
MVPALRIHPAPLSHDGNGSLLPDFQRNPSGRTRGFLILLLGTCLYLELKKIISNDETSQMLENLKNL